MFNFWGLIGNFFSSMIVDILYLPFNFKYMQLLKELKTEKWFRELYGNQNYKQVILHNMKLKTFLLTRGNIEKVKTDDRYRETFIRIIKDNELI